MFQKRNDIIVKGRTIQFVMHYRLCLMWIHLFNELYFSEPFVCPLHVSNHHQCSIFICHCDNLCKMPDHPVSCKDLSALTRDFSSDPCCERISSEKNLIPLIKFHETLHLYVCMYASVPFCNVAVSLIYTSWRNVDVFGRVERLDSEHVCREKLDVLRAH